VPKISFLSNYPLFPTLSCRGPQSQLGPNRVGAVQTKLVASRLGWRNHMARIVVKTTPDVAAFSGVVCYVLCLYMYVESPKMNPYPNRIRVRNQIRIGIGGTVSLQTSERSVVKFSVACVIFSFPISALFPHTHTANTHSTQERAERREEAT